MERKSACRDRAPMGWNSWDCYGAAVTEEIVKKNADYMAKELKAFGWEYVVVDIQWSSATARNNEYHPFEELCMDEYSRLIPAPNRFPSSKDGRGFAPLAEYVHSLGLKFGIHIMRGIPRQAVHRNTPIKASGADGRKLTARDVAKTASICVWNTDMYGVDPKKEGAKEYYESLFSLYASWGVDFVKCDDICRELPHEEEELILLSRAMSECGRDMVLSLSPGPALLEKAELYKEVADMWRITDDFWDQWDLLYAMFERAEKWSIHTGAGNWPDADMLPIGPLRQVYDPSERTHFTREEQRTMMTLWSIFRSPLMIGGEMTGFDDFTRSLVTNEKILSIHKNARFSHQVWRRKRVDTELVLWLAISAEGGYYAALFNIGEKDAKYTLTTEEMEIGKIRTREELWSGETASDEDTFTAEVNAHDVKVWKLEVLEV